MAGPDAALVLLGMPGIFERTRPPKRACAPVALRCLEVPLCSPILEVALLCQSASVCKRDWVSREFQHNPQIVARRPRHATPRHATPRHATPRHTTPHATPRHATPRHATPRHTPRHTRHARRATQRNAAPRNGCAQQRAGQPCATRQHAAPRCAARTAGSLPIHARHCCVQPSLGNVGFVCRQRPAPHTHTHTHTSRRLS